MKRLAIFGTHGAAKTTLVYKLAAYFKMQDKNVTVIHETARQCPFPINTNAVYQTTLFVIASQLKAELQAEAQGFEIAISDRTLYDAFIYIDNLKKGNNYTEALKVFCFEWLKQYDVLVYLEPTKGFVLKTDGIRAPDQNYQKIIRNEFRFFLEEVKEKFSGKLKIIQAESNQVFESNQCLDLIKQIKGSLYERTRDPLMV